MKKIVSFVLALTLAFSVIAAFSACGKKTGQAEKNKSEKTDLVEVNLDEKTSVVYEYYYKTIYSNYVSYSQQYDSSYGQGYGLLYTGYDYNKLPEEQEYAGDDFKPDDGSTPNWKQYFEYQALLTLKRMLVLEAMANEAGYQATEEVRKQAESSLKSLRSYVNNQQQSSGSAVSVDEYLQDNFGKGMSEALLKKIVEREVLADSYYKKLLEDKADGYSDERVKTEYDKNPTAYDCVDFRLFLISPETAETEAAQEKAAAAAKKKAEEMYGRITDEASFQTLAAQYATETQKESLDFSEDTATLHTYATKSALSSLDESITAWLFADTTKEGDKQLFDVNGACYLLLMVKPRYKDDTKTVDVRHILYQFDDTLTGEEKTKDEQAQKAAAEAAQKKINSSANKLDTFLEICASDSADTGSNQNGGLYERVGRGQYVKAFEEWSLDPSRKAGDVGVVRTEYGYHVMYFEKALGKTVWGLEITETLAEDEMENEIDGKIKALPSLFASEDELKKLNDQIYSDIKKQFSEAANG